MCIFINYIRAQNLNQKPALLIFPHPDTNKPMHILGKNPIITLEVKNNILYKNNIKVGSALDIFAYFKLPKSKNFFPAFIGFFSYEFAKYFGRPVSKLKNNFPDAYFRLYNYGIIKYYNNNKFFSPQINLPQDLQPEISKQDFIKKINLIKKQIKNGYVYQVNLSSRFSFNYNNQNLVSLLQNIYKINPSPFMGLISNNNWSILSGSPERLFSLRNQIISTRPIAGTKARAHDCKKEAEIITELKNCPKENAEHAMLVDLLRHDVNQIAHENSSSVSEDRSIEFYSHVMHLVSQIDAQTKASLENIFKAMFPGGTITGAPKHSVMNSIAQLEESSRGPYTGSLGYISGGFGCDFNILIRSIFSHQNKNYTHTGAGIVIDSDPEKEWQELLHKAQFVQDILTKQQQAKPKRELIKGPAQKPTTNFISKTKYKVLFIENQDSFSYNIIKLLEQLGCKVIIKNSYLHKNLTNFSHILIGPGPGIPKDYPVFKKIINFCQKTKTPLLGICLGHQAIAEYFGAQIIHARNAIHGKLSHIKHMGTGLFKNIPNPLRATRYHSLVIKQAPENFSIDAYSDDDYIMGISHKFYDIFGLQFHPESYLSQWGEQIIFNFLKNI